jgi:tetratricopeptide (TPR) repeat protein
MRLRRRYAPRVHALEIGLVDIVREFLLAHHELRRLFERQRARTLRWEEVARLVGDTEASVLFRLKERCHAQFRSGDRDAGVARVALFDLAVGSLFHEAMKLRENFYQLEVYAPRVEAARGEAAAGTEALFEEFERILAASRDRLAEAFLESEALLEQTRRQFRVLLADHRRNGLVARYLLENASLVEEVLGEPLDQLFAGIHGDPVVGYAIAARSYLESGFFDEGRRALAEALARDPERPELRRASAYAEGMSAYLLGRYEEALHQLERWAEEVRAAEESPLRALAHAAVSRLEQLVEGEQLESLARRAGALARRLTAQEPGPSVEP